MPAMNPNARALVQTRPGIRSAAVLGSVLVVSSLLAAPANAATTTPASVTAAAPQLLKALTPPALTLPKPPGPVIAPAAPARPVVTRVSRSASRAPQVQTVVTTSAAPGRLGAALAIARQKIGAPYAYGASGPNAFDCSGLVQYALREAGFGTVPRTAAGQASIAHRIDRSALQPGDLIFFTRGGSVYHVGFFVGWSNGTALILHAPNAGSRVQIAPVWTDSWFAGTL